MDFKGSMDIYNCDPLVLGPELAMESIPRPVCDRFGLNSSSNDLPQIDLPPAPVPVGSPPCICKEMHILIVALSSQQKATYNKIPYRAMKQYAIVITVGAMFYEIIACAWCLLAV